MSQNFNAQVPFMRNNGLNARLSPRASHYKVVEEYDAAGGNQYTGTVSGFKKNSWLWAIIILFVVGLILYLVKPSWVLKRDNLGQIIPCTSTPNALVRCEVDWGRLILWTIGITLVIFLVIWLIASASKA